MRPPEIALEIAKRSLAVANETALGVGIGLKSAHYPAPGTLPVLPTMVMLLRTSDITVMNEQYWMLNILGRIFMSPDNLPAAISLVDGLIVPIVDAFDPAYRGAGGSWNFTLDGAVSHCMVTHVDFGATIQYGGPDKFYGGEITWDVKLRRFRNDT